jgi:deoxyadenosine/deoxycytidine kinase
MMIGERKRNSSTVSEADQSASGLSWFTRLLSSHDPAGRIEVCGSIGVGKSTVAACLAGAWDLPLVREIYEDVPFWAKYYAEPEEYELEKNVSFLLAHGEAIRAGLRARGSGGMIFLDFALFQDLAYSDLSSRRADAAVMEMLYERLVDRFRTPTLLIHLRCPIEVQIDRIRRRGREPEADLGEPFLSALSRSIEARVDRLRTEVPVIDVDSSALDFVGEPTLAVAAVGMLIRDRLAALSAAK